MVRTISKNEAYRKYKAGIPSVSIDSREEIEEELNLAISRRFYGTKLGDH